MAVEPEARIGEVFEAKYQIEELLGTGAMGSVFRARHVAIGRPFAVKLLHRRLVKDPKLIKRFEREAAIAGKLNHPNVVSVVDVGTHDGISFLVMDLAEGTPLTQLLADAPFAPARALSLLRQLCDGLDHAHEHGLIHRDLKPDNIIVEADGTARIVDFGIALLRDAGSEGGPERITTGGVVLGTPQYMAPELAMGSDIDHRVDLFALGVICFQMFTGRMPFAGDGVTVATANITQPTPKMGGIDPLFEALTHTLMAKEPAKRPATAAATRQLVDLIERDRAAAARMLGVEDRPRTPSDGLAIVPAFAIGSSSIGNASTVAIATAPTLAVTTSDLVPPVAKRSRRPLVVALVALALAIVAAAAIAYFVLREPKAEAPAVVPHAQTENADEPRAHVRSADVAPPPSAPEPTAPRTAPPGKPTPAPITADAVARHYALVGRKLKQLSLAGVELPEQWARYKTIHISEAMATQAQIDKTEALLAEIDRAIASK